MAQTGIVYFVRSESYCTFACIIIFANVHSDISCKLFSEP